MKKKEDDLARIDGVYIPTWAKVLSFILAAAISFALFYFLPKVLF